MHTCADLLQAAAARAAAAEVAALRMEEPETRATGALAALFLQFRTRLMVQLSWPPAVADLYCTLRIGQLRAGGLDLDDEHLQLVATNLIREVHQGAFDEA